MHYTGYSSTSPNYITTPLASPAPPRISTIHTFSHNFCGKILHKMFFFSRRKIWLIRSGSLLKLASVCQTGLWGIWISGALALSPVYLIRLGPLQPRLWCLCSFPGGHPLPQSWHWVPDQAFDRLHNAMAGCAGGADVGSKPLPIQHHQKYVIIC